mgnify:CR=1 FL=1
MGLINWIFDFYQQSRIEDLRSDLERSRVEAASIRTSGGSIDGQRLERAIGELALAVKTLQRVAVEKGLCTPAGFNKRCNRSTSRTGDPTGACRSLIAARRRAQESLFGFRGVRGFALGGLLP